MGEQPLFPYPEHVERLAQTYASQVIRRLSNSKDTPEHTENKDQEPEFVNININSIEKFEPRTVGAEHLMLQMANQLELPEKSSIGLSKQMLQLL